VIFGVTAYLPSPQAGTWAHVQTQVLGAAASSVSFTGLSGVAFYQLTAHLPKDALTNNPTLLVRFNNDSAANYSASRVKADGAAPSSATVTGQTSIGTASTFAANGISALRAVAAKPAAAVRAQLWMQIQIDTTALACIGESIIGEWNNVAATINRIDVLFSADQFAALSAVRLDQKAAA